MEFAARRPGRQPGRRNSQDCANPSSLVGEGAVGGVSLGSVRFFFFRPQVWAVPSRFGAGGEADGTGFRPIVADRGVVASCPGVRWRRLGGLPVGQVRLIAASCWRRPGRRLGGVVGEDAVAAQGLSAGQAVHEAAAPAPVASKRRDSPFGPGAPLDELAEPTRRVRRPAAALWQRLRTMATNLTPRPASSRPSGASAWRDRQPHFDGPGWRQNPSTTSGD